MGDGWVSPSETAETITVTIHEPPTAWSESKWGIVFSSRVRAGLGLTPDMAMLW